MSNQKRLISSVLGGLSIGDGCWYWRGSINHNGYGRIQFKIDGKRVEHLAHRAVYELFVGVIPKELEIDHLCRNPKCVRPDHLEAVSHAENMRRMGPHNRWNHCAKGHLIAGDNAIPAGNGRFRCRECKKEISKRRDARLRAQGLCWCGRPPKDGCSNCQRCIDRHS